MCSTSPIKQDLRPKTGIELFIAYYAQQRRGEHALTETLDSATIPVQNTPTKINEYFIQNAGRRMIVFYWYQSKDRIIADEYLGKLLLVRDTLIDGHTAGTIVRIMVPDVPGAAEQALSFAKSLVSQVQQCLAR